MSGKLEQKSKGFERQRKNRGEWMSLKTEEIKLKLDFRNLKGMQYRQTGFVRSIRNRISEIASKKRYFGTDSK
jgi:hypothetical protein